MRISELAGSAGVPTSTVRYYERVGLMGLPERTASGYREYDDDAASRLLFITRARRMGLSCDQITDLLPVWAGTNCGAAHDRVMGLIEEKQAGIGHQGATDGGGLLLAAREGPGPAVSQRLEEGKGREHALEVPRTRPPMPPGDEQVLDHRHLGKQAAALGDQRDAQRDAAVGGQRGDVEAIEAHASGARRVRAGAS